MAEVVNKRLNPKLRMLTTTLSWRAFRASNMLKTANLIPLLANECHFAFNIELPAGRGRSPKYLLMQPYMTTAYRTQSGRM